MGFKPFKALTRALGVPDKYTPIVAGALAAVTAGSSAILGPVGGGVATGIATTITPAAVDTILAGHPGQSSESHSVQYDSYQQPFSQQYYVAPTGFSDFAPTQGYAPPQYTTDPYANFNYEVPPWDYSTSFPVTQPTVSYRAPTMAPPSTSSPTYSGLVGTAEDILGMALPLFL
jgi:hypothetical protein